MVTIYTKREIEILAESGKILSDVLRHVAGTVREGVSTWDLDKMAEDEIRERGGVPSFLGYHEHGMRPYPASLCTSINDELVHCIPYKDRKLSKGDIIGLDLGVTYKGLITDMAVTVAVGDVPARVRLLLDTTRKSLEAAIASCRPGARLGDVGNTVQLFAEKEGFGVIRDLVGHGVGHTVHEDPKVPNYGKRGTGAELKEGMVIAIEPMFTMGSWKIRMLADGWGIATADNSLCAHFEKTVAITSDGARILTP